MRNSIECIGEHSAALSSKMYSMLIIKISNRFVLNCSNYIWIGSSDRSRVLMRIAKWSCLLIRLVIKVSPAAQILFYSHVGAEKVTQVYGNPPNVASNSSGTKTSHRLNLNIERAIHAQLLDGGVAFDMLNWFTQVICGLY